MRRIYWVFALCMLFAVTALAENQIYVPFTAEWESPQYVPDQFVIKFKAGIQEKKDLNSYAVAKIGVSSIDLLNQRYGVVAIQEEFPGAMIEPGMPDLTRYRVVTYQGRQSLEEVIGAFAADPNIESVEPIGIHPMYDVVPNDYYFAGQAYPWNQWGMSNTADHDIDAPCAWSINPGNSNAIVAVADGGVRYYHKDLGGASWPTTSGNIWKNPGEINGNGIDDDANGYVDDWIGWDWVTGVKGCKKGEDCSATDNDPRDFGGHGTHCAGIVGAITNNATGVAGTAGGWGNGTSSSIGNGAKIMCLRIGWLSTGGVGYVRMDFAAQAFYYAANKGAHVISCSWGSSNTSGFGAAVDYAVAHGVLVVHAAGNSNNTIQDYLATRADVIDVAATDTADLKASFSSYGSWVDVSAPGVDIVSTYHNYSDPSNDYYAVMSGTSMATPNVAGMAALIKSQYPSYTWSQIRDQIKATTDNIDGLNPSYAGQLGTGRINACKAIGGTPSPKQTTNQPLPDQYALYQNYPNPFNPATTISFYLGRKTMATLTVYNILGERVKTLINGNLEAGSHSVIWNGTDESGSNVASGMYFYRLTIDGESTTRKMTLLK
jgi:subtilisin family serine protease